MLDFVSMASVPPQKESRECVYTNLYSNTDSPLYMNGSHGIILILEEFQSLWENIIVGVVVTFFSVSFSVSSSSSYSYYAGSI